MTVGQTIEAAGTLTGALGGTLVWINTGATLDAILMAFLSGAAGALGAMVIQLGSRKLRSLLNKRKPKQTA